MTDELKTWAEEQAYERAKAEYMEKLDKIKAEIEHLTYYWCEVNSKFVIDDILQIIDRYRTEKRGRQCR